jgi:hypothetical protein
MRNFFPQAKKSFIIFVFFPRRLLSDRNKENAERSCRASVLENIFEKKTKEI